MNNLNYNNQQKQNLFLLFIFSCFNTLVFAQISEYKHFKKGKYEKVEKGVNKVLSKDGNDARANFVQGLLRNQKKYAAFNPENAFHNFEKASKYYNQIDEKTKLKLEKEGVVLDTIFFHRNISFDLGLEYACTVNTIIAYQHFIDFYKGSTSQRLIAVQKRDILAFQIAMKSNTEAAYIQFLTQYPNAAQLDSAIRYRDVCALKTAKQKNSSEAIVQFIQKYPNSHLKFEADREKNRLLFVEQTDGTVDGYIRFCENNSKSHYFDMAVDSIELLSFQSRHIGGMKFLCANPRYLDNFVTFQDKLFDALLFDGHPVTFNNIYKDFGNYLDPYHRTKLQDWSYEVGEVESLFFNIGVTDNNYFAYETFVNNLAPLDLAWVALQRMIESDIKNKDWTSAKVTLTEFEAKFQTKNGNKVTDLLNELEKAETSVTISSLKRVNTAYDEYAPVPSLDGKRLFFCGKERKDNIGGEDIFESSGKNGVFGTADMVSSLSSPYGNEAPLSISADGNTMFLWTGDSNGDIQTSSIGLNGLWTAPVSLPYPINTKYYEGDAMLSADGRTIIFVSTRPGGENFYVENNMSYFGDDNYQTDIYISNKLDNGKWSNPVNLGSKINTPYSERSPYLHPDGKTLYFSSEGHAGFGRLDVFKSTLLSEDWRDWSVPENLGKEINSSENDWGFKFSTDGKNVFYAAKEKSAEKSSLILLLDVSGSMGEGNKMEAMREAAHEVCVSALANNTEVSILAFNGSCYEPFSFYCQFSDDAKQLTDFISDVYADGGTPMYEAFEMASVYMKDAAQKSSASKSIILMSDGDANSCETLKAVIGRLRSKGSIYKTYTIALEVDEGSQAYDDLMYISTRTKGAFFHAETAEDLGTVFAQASTKIFDFTMKSSSSDIFTFTLPEDLRPELVTTISGVIKNSKSQPISAKVSWEDLSTGENMGTATTNPSDGSYFIVLPTGRNYGYFVDNDQYFPSSNNVDLRNASSMEEIKVDVDMVSFEELLSGNKSVKINNIFFETAKFDLKSESFVELNRILPILNEYIDYQVVIEGHTDNVGNKNYNIELSEKRALAVANYLNSKGYKRDDIEFIGYGFEQPVNDNSTASKKALNRRVEIKLIKK